jgi:hypothetical protein
MNRLRSLFLSGAGITHIPPGAFKIATHLTTEYFQIILWHNKLNGWSFEFGALSFPTFEKKAVPVHLDFDSNQITYLDEKIFRPFLASKLNVVLLNGNPIDCADKKSAWVCGLSKEDRHRILYAYCNGIMGAKSITDCK